MASNIYFGNTDVERIMYNNQDITKVMYDGEVIWPSAGSFTLNGTTTFQFTLGTTWADWSYSAYNTTEENARIQVLMFDGVEGLHVLIDRGDGTVDINSIYDSNGVEQQPTDLIVNGANYTAVMEPSINYPVYIENMSSYEPVRLYWNSDLTSYYDIETNSAIETTMTSPVYVSDATYLYVHQITGGTYAAVWKNDIYCYEFTITDESNGLNVILNGNGDICCFEAGTQVLMADGTTKNIEDIAAGDKVKTYDLITGRFIDTVVNYKAVNNNVTHVAIVELDNGMKVRMNEYHPLLTVDGYHSITQHEGLPELIVGDTIITTEGLNKVVNIDRTMQEPETMYNLGVNNNNHNYVVNGIVAHNAAPCPT